MVDEFLSHLFTPGYGVALLLYAAAFISNGGRSRRRRKR